MDECGVCTNIVLTVFVFDTDYEHDVKIRLTSIYAYFCVRELWHRRFTFSNLPPSPMAQEWDITIALLHLS